MENFQKEIRDYLGVAVPGTLVEAAESYKLLEHFITEDDTCSVGEFVRLGTKEGYVKGAASDGDVIGIIVKDQYLTGCELGMKLPAGITCSVAVFGVIAVKNTSTASATLLDDVFLKKDGTLAFSKESVASASKTHWAVKQGAEKDGIVFVAR